jgi:hypothetical protein
MTPARITIALALVAALAGPSRSASAANGIVEIDQEKALTGGVTPDDAPGFPVTLSEPGSYRLTGDLEIPGGVHGIVVEADGLTLDLGGFRVGAARPQPGDSSNSVIWGPERSRVTIQNGSIAVLEKKCITLGSHARIWSVRVASYRGGMVLGDFSIVAESDASGGDSKGLHFGGILIDSTVSASYYIALTASPSVVVDSSVGTLWGVALLGANRSMIRRTNIRGRGGPPTAYVGVTSATVVEDVVVGYVGSRMIGGSLGASAGSSVSESAILAATPSNQRRGTRPDGLVLDTDSTYRDNTITTDGGVAVIGGVNLGGNTCNAEPCP